MSNKPTTPDELGPSRSEPLHDLYSQGKPHEVDGYYGISVRIAPLVLAALNEDPSLSDFQALDARFDKALLRFDPSNPREVENLVTYFPQASVILVTRGKVDRIMSMSMYAHTVNATPSSDSSDDPVGC